MRISFRVKSNNTLYLRDPEQTELGRKIINWGILLIDKLGFDDFSFKKLAIEIESTEASIYRYFENKNKLLIYLISWYWSWVNFRIDYQTNNIKDPMEKMKIVIKVISESFKDDPDTEHVDEEALSRVVGLESSRLYMSKNIENEYKEGSFEAYTELCNKVCNIIKDVNPDYATPKALFNTVIWTAHKQIFFATTLPELTELKVENKNNTIDITKFLENLTFNLLKAK
ncbi:MAG: TetR/AcrR family transcriptional regulator [Candidatus Sericytochromatia bacterium]|nr:TetR/AcrR family transcriptional regulator [Candidatus Sericytochromatia bacterium]